MNNIEEWRTYVVSNLGRVDHIDKNSFNNNADNLRCVTPKENSNNRAPSIQTILGILDLHEEGLSPTEIRTKLNWRQ